MASVDEFDVDDFLDSRTASRIQAMLSEAVYKGVMKAFWTIFMVQVILGLLLVLFTVTSSN